MKNSKTYLSLFVAIVLASGCASGPKYADVAKTLPPMAADQGRIFLYRSGSFVGSAVQPSIMLNDKKVGDSVPGGFFYVDRAKGDYQLSSTTEVKRSLSLTLDPGQVRYVRFSVGMGFFVGHVYPELIENEKGEKEIKDCHYTGKP